MYFNVMNIHKYNFSTKYSEVYFDALKYPRQYQRILEQSGLLKATQLGPLPLGGMFLSHMIGWNLNKVGCFDPFP